MTLKLLFLAGILFFLSFCSDTPGGAGDLMPQKADGINIVTTEKTNDTVQIKSAGETISLSGKWANQSWQRLEIRLDNNSGSVRQFDYSKVKIRGENGEDLVLNFVLDTSDSRFNDGSQSPKEPKQIYSVDSKQKNEMPLAVSPGETKTLSLNFNNFTSPQNALTKGKKVFVTIPDFQTGQLHEITFDCR
jgi:hypothetical protein